MGRTVVIHIFRIYQDSFKLNRLFESWNPSQFTGAISITTAAIENKD
jgi:hypothetical protein